ncbi:MAG: glycosyltransferase [Cyanobacteria bacterium J083]|nr:MAG: glycosyltransferase [Cyanobacteria bacterium J083]
MTDFTVAICTYNGSKTLSQVLDKLRSQANVEQLNWEILVIDNNSTDDTAKIVETYQLVWTESYPLKYFFEPQQGLAFARRCAIQESNSPLIGFLDDDNLPEENWVAAAYSFAQEHPQAGAYGGQIHGKFEVEPPANFGRIARFFALIEGDHTYCYNEKYQNSKIRMFPPGAGIVIRKQAWLESIPPQPLLPQTNEDLEMLSQIWQQGWQIWFNAQMHLDHLIPASRFEKSYLKKFFRQNGLMRYYVRMLRYKPWQQALMTPVYLVNDLKKLIMHLLKYRKVLKTDVVAIGEMELLIGIVLSPFFAVKKN